MRPQAYYGQASRWGSSIWLSNVRCKGDEKGIEDCKHDRWTYTGSCTHKNDVSVDCIPKEIKQGKLNERTAENFYIIIPNICFLFVKGHSMLHVRHLLTQIS